MNRISIDQLRARRDEIVTVAAHHGAHNVRVFGSVARGDARPDSDIDILVVVDAGRSLIDLIGLEQRLTERLGRPVDVFTEGGLSPYIKQRVQREAAIL